MNANKTYKSCAKVRRDIDRVLHANAILFQNSDPDAKKKERINLQAIEHIDPEFIGFLLSVFDDA